MLLVKLAIDRAMAEAKDTKDKQPGALGTTEVTRDAQRRRYNGGLRKEQLAVQTQPSQPPLVTDSEWLALNAEEQLAWAKNIQDPRIAVGSHSPLEKKIKIIKDSQLKRVLILPFDKSLGGVHSSEVRKLLAEKTQQENERLDQLKAMSFDFRFAQAEAYYYQHYQEMLEEACKHKMVPEGEIKTEEKERRPHNEKKEDAKKWHYLVPERELNQIQKHIYRAEQARGLRDHNYQLLPQSISDEIPSHKVLNQKKDENTENIQKTHKIKAKQYRVAWAKKQIKGHQERMILGRELTEKRNSQRVAQKIPAQAPPFLKPQVKKKEVKEYEWVTTYPIVQPYAEALLEVTVLMEKSKKEGKIGKPL
ncbi:trichohyalin-like isoform X1 [Odocoileus virginianus]|uniref:Trichohyalin-like isoform X1 n=1 Tax=Odocoileus virginianus TaxID=9874 RepID=A0A6J0YXI2_ODOVR